MKLKSAKFKNYRCFSDFSIDLHSELNVFVGENGAGKTAAIEGITQITPREKFISSVLGSFVLK